MEKIPGEAVGVFRALLGPKTVFEFGTNENTKYVEEQDGNPRKQNKVEPFQTKQFFSRNLHSVNSEFIKVRVNLWL